MASKRFLKRALKRLAIAQSAFINMSNANKTNGSAAFTKPGSMKCK